MNQPMVAGTRLPPNMPPSGIAAKACLKLARLFLTGPLKRYGFRQESITRFDSMGEYIQDRVIQIQEYLTLFRPYTRFEGKTVLELGCNRGYLLDAFLHVEQFDALGADIDEEALGVGRKTYGERIRFIHSTPAAIPLPNATVDVAYTIDTVEHLIRLREIFMEVHRVLRPGGTFLIHFHPWLGPYGSHLEDIVPFPWPHVVFSMNTLLDVAAYLYESPEHKVAAYFLDPATGAKKPNPYLDRSKWDNYLNHILVRQFRAVLRELPFEIVFFEKHGFGGAKYRIARHLAWLAQLPGFDEFFCKAVFCVLRKPEERSSVTTETPS